MRHRLRFATTAVSLYVFNGHHFVAADEWDAKVDEIMASFTNVDLAGQMTQITSYMLLNSSHQVNEEVVRGLAKHHAGSRIQEIAMEENGGHPIIYGTDAAHGNASVAACVRDVRRGPAPRFSDGSRHDSRFFIQSYPEAACMKHWIAYTWNPTGHDKDGVEMSDYDLMNTYFPSFKAAVDAGLLTGMENYISVNGVPVIQNYDEATVQ
ncbi:unnamed protein product [Phytophthora lilii]|uniref:beta-glucosidase n=1 Tax=Phytophthora lilii TaxID=2077276 RepID=A0A9W6TMA5_9STRA|nr:unnamed protein product [Phytophthora lilii]